MSPLADERRIAEQRRMLVMEDTRRSQGFMQVYWMHMLRRLGFNFQGAYLVATLLSQSWYAWQWLKIELLGMT